MIFLIMKFKHVKEGILLIIKFIKDARDNWLMMQIIG